jgi:hypothetical protein
MSTRGTGRITREVTDIENQKKDSLLIFKSAITLWSLERYSISLLDLVRCLIKSLCNS